MSDENLTQKFRNMETDDILRQVAGTHANSHPRLAADYEFQRRVRRPGEIRSWIAIGIAIFSFITSISFAIFK